jgi:MFS transporter, ACS family, tartrate transporter
MLTRGSHIDIAESTRSRVTRRLMPFLFFVYIVSYIDRNNIGFAGLQMTGELGFKDSVFGLGSGIFFLGYTLLGIPGAMLVEKWSARKTMATTMLLWGMVAAATGLIQSVTQFYSMRFLLGVTEAAFFPGIITYLGHWYRPKDRAKAVAMFMAAIPASQTIAAPLSAAMLKVHWLGMSGWRWLLILQGAPAILCALGSLVFLTDRPRDAKWLDPEQREWLSAELARSAAKQKAYSAWSALANRDVWLLCLAYFCGTVGTYGLNLWLPKMIQRYGHLANTETALLSAIPAMAGIPAMLLCGWHSDKTGERHWHASIPRVLAGFAIAAVTAQGLGLAGVVFFFSVAFAGIVAAYPPIWGIPAQVFSTTGAAASIGLISSLGNLGGFAGPYAIGWLSDRTGSYNAGLWFVAVILVLGGLVVMLIRKPEPT